MSDQWYIVKRPIGNCDLVPLEKIAEETESNITQKWGPYDSKDDAIARRVGLIRAGKCQPV